jgi:hypothetical protein
VQTAALLIGWLVWILDIASMWVSWYYWGIDSRVTFADDKITASGGYKLLYSYSCRTTSTGSPGARGWGTSSSPINNVPLDFCAVTDLRNLPGDISVTYPFRAGVISAFFVIGALILGGAANLILDEKRRGYPVFRWLPAPWVLRVYLISTACQVRRGGALSVSGGSGWPCRLLLSSAVLFLCNDADLAISGSFYGPGLGLIVIASVLNIAGTAVSYVFRSELASTSGPTITHLPVTATPSKDPRVPQTQPVQAGVGGAPPAQILDSDSSAPALHGDVPPAPTDDGLEPAHPAMGVGASTAQADLLSRGPPHASSGEHQVASTSTPGSRAQKAKSAQIHHVEL